MIAELGGGLYGFNGVHPRIGMEVWGYLLLSAGQAAFFDPLIDDETEPQLFSLIDSHNPPTVVVLLTNRHHYRSASLLVERYGARVLCQRAGLHEFNSGEPVTGFDLAQSGVELAHGVVVYRVGVLCPEEVAYHLPSHSALVVGDAVVGAGQGRVGFVPDQLMDDPPRTKAGLLARFDQLNRELKPQRLLLAHGGPLLDRGGEALGELIAAGGRTAFEL